MPIKLAPHQLAFWRELLAPFAPDPASSALTKRGGKELTYIDKRSLTNRLDSILGPDGWYPEIRGDGRAATSAASTSACRCRPKALKSSMAKDDGAGFEEMGAINKTTSEFEYDVDNDEKSATRTPSGGPPRTHGESAATSTARVSLRSSTRTLRHRP